MDGRMAGGATLRNQYSQLAVQQQQRDHDRDRDGEPKFTLNLILDKNVLSTAPYLLGEGRVGRPKTPTKYLSAGRGLPAYLQLQ